MDLFGYWVGAIMPTFTSQPDETSGVDTFINAGDATQNYATTVYVAVGENNTSTSTYRTLIKFDVSSIPKSALLVSATLSVWTALDLSSTTRNYKLFRVKRDWVEAEATWNVWSTGNNWGTGGCSNTTTDYDTTVWATKSFGSAIADDTQMDFVFDATGLTELKKFIDGTYTNYGWMIKADTETDDAYRLHSSSSATAGYRPRLVIEYIVGDFFMVFFR